ncbi:MAG: MFS transporter [Acidobacteria bacterium]|nr:MFS transporter [Acidobacteriota bacterium]
MTRSEEARLPATPRAAYICLHAAFFLTGVVTTLLGPILPVLAREWQVSDVQAGYLFSAQFLASMIAVVCSGEISARRSYRFTLAFGLGLMAVGVASLGFGSWRTGLASVACYGAGLGLVIPTANLLVVHVNPRGSAGRLNVLNLFWTLGAVCWPGIVALGSEIRGMQLLLTSLALSLVAAAALLAIGALPPTHDSFQDSGSAAPEIKGSRPIYPVFALGASFFLYVGMETSLTGWATSYAMGLPRVPPGTAVLMPSFFWGSMILGRAIAPVLLRSVSERWLYLGSVGTAIFGSGAFLLSSRVPGAVTGLSLAGLGAASLFPCLVSKLSELFGARATRAGGVFFALAGLGGAALPWAVGLASGYLQDLRAALILVVIAQFCLLVLRFFKWSPTPVSPETAS